MKPLSLACALALAGCSSAPRSTTGTAGATTATASTGASSSGTASGTTSGTTSGTGTSSGTTSGLGATTSGNPGCPCPHGDTCTYVDGGEVICVQPDGGQCPYFPRQSCGVNQNCDCRDGTTALAGCVGPPTCNDACCGHGGSAISDCVAFGASCLGASCCDAGLVCVDLDDAPICLIDEGYACLFDAGGCASSNCALGKCTCQALGHNAVDCAECCAGACDVSGPSGGVCK